MRRIKNWKLFTESVQDSLDDIKWAIVDYDIEDYEYYPNSTKLLSFLVNDKDKVRNEIKRIKGIVNEEDWNVIYNEAVTAPLIFYKCVYPEYVIDEETIKEIENEYLEAAIINWLDENYGGLDRKVYIDKNTLHVNYIGGVNATVTKIIFKYEIDDADSVKNVYEITDQVDIEAYRLFYELPLECFKKDVNSLDGILKRWLKEKYDINVRNIYFEEYAFWRF